MTKKYQNQLRNGEIKKKENYKDKTENLDFSYLWEKKVIEEKKANFKHT